MTDSPEPDWYLKEWLAHFGKRQASLVKELGWDKARASFVFNGKQGYRREIVNEIAGWLRIKPHELLMHPTEAMSLRRLRESAAQIVAHDPPPPFRSAAPKRTPVAAARTGTRG